MEQTKILVVEDDREINSMLCEMLDENGKKNQAPMETLP